jgi:hypothetical protein
MMRWLALVLAMLFAPAGFGQLNPIQQQTQRVEGALNRLSIEQQAVYQQFQMIQELRRNEERLALQRLPIYRSSTVVAPSYDDIQRDEEARNVRMNDLQAEGDRLYARYRELEDQKRPLLDTLAALAQAPLEPVPPELPPDTAAIPLPTPVPPVTAPSTGFTGAFPGFTGGAPGFTPQPVTPPPPARPSR